MRKITIICVGKLREPWWNDAEDEFLKRLRPYAKIRIEEVAAAPTTASFGPEQAMKLEGEAIMKRLPEHAAIVALDRPGKRMDSPMLAQFIDRETEGGRELAFVIGGAQGLAAEVLARASATISLSPLTFTHEMARVFLLEQLYRSETILAGKTYHY